MHAAALARELGVNKVIIPIASSVFSAWGMLMTDLRHDYIQTYIVRLNDLDPELINKEWGQLENRAYNEFLHEGVKKDSVMFSRYLDMRYLGQEHTVKVPVPSGEWNNEILRSIIRSFHELHEKAYSFKLENSETEIVNLHLTALGLVKKPKLEKRYRSGDVKDALKEVRPVYFEKTGWVQTNIYDREKLPTLKTVNGPAIIEEKASVTVVYQDQTLVVDDYGNLIIEIGVK
ncbi:hypothetical protein BpJC7_16620 [Weizmannia acidilactici]|uniref:Hydantoinase A/oxoprolinase domain-containing protein n=1 Tax=Weizmannia acidilactici TaxID=2607726 RepID=A0A5J4JFZ7_9BACI|nr:hypothetical protein BpJC4_28050 [Weizmannia acidilactici]GER70359.1 hypothetical protein BpJC7_16620 [Weizmannia acidilactici]GER74692.1 hypothetical protein BpPP18_27590 [Weizmannia acidilactici]